MDACINEILSTGHLSRQEADEILGHVKEIKDRLLAEGRIDKIDQRLAQAASDVAEKAKLAAMLQRKHAAMTVIRRHALTAQIDRMVADTGDHKEAFLALLYGSHNRATGARKSISARRNAIVSEWLGGMTTEISREHPEVMALLKRDAGFLKNVVREMHEIKPGGQAGVSGDPLAEWTAGLFAKYSEAARQRLNAAGANIGKLDGWSPQGHDAGKLIKAKVDAWIDAIIPRIDLDRSFPGMDEAQVRGVLSEVYENIVTGRGRTMSPAQKATAFIGPRNLARSLEKHRVLHFKSADDWLAYHEQFGRGNVFTAILGHLEKSARLASLMEVLGPNPENMLRALVESQRHKIRLNTALDPEAKAAALASLENDIGKRQGAIGRAFAEVTGETLIPENVTAAKISSGIRAVQSMAKLGAATLSSINDVLTYTMGLRYQGKNLLESYADVFQTMFHGKTPQEKKELSYLLGATFDGIVDDIAARWNAQDAIPGKMADLMDKFFRYSGLTWWTNRLKSGFARAASANLAANAGLAAGELSKPMQHLLKIHGIDARRWDVIRKAAAEAADGRRYILPETIDSLSDQAIDAAIPEKLARIKERYKLRKTDSIERGKEKFAARLAAEKKARADARREIKSDLMAMIVDETDHAVIAPDDRTRAVMVQGTRPGTALGEAARFISQFKSFPIAYGQKILKARRFQVEGKGVDPAGIAHLITASIGLGYAAMVMKDLSKGRTPRDPRHWETWLAAILQGGGAGIYGDFLFGKYDRFGGGAIESAAGPTAGTAGRIVEMGSRLIRGDADAGDAFYLAINNTPFVNLWYTRAALDYAIMYHAQEMLSPGTLARRERRLKEEFGQSFIMPPSQVIARGGGFK